jgi:ketosteroid isomerase-like protein
MISRRNVVGLGILSLSGAATETGQARDPGNGAMSDRDLIAAAIDRFVEAYNAGDLPRVLGYYSDDLIKLRDGAATETKAEAARRIEQGFRDFQGHLVVSNEEIVTSGDLAYTRGSFRLTLTPRGGGADRVFERRFLEIWRKRHGEWRVLRTMDNTGAPADEKSNLS